MQQEEEDFHQHGISTVLTCSSQPSLQLQEVGSGESPKWSVCRAIR